MTLTRYPVVLREDTPTPLWSGCALVRRYFGPTSILLPAFLQEPLRFLYIFSSITLCTILEFERSPGENFVSYSGN
jgi:hypothetical protein